MDFFKDHHVFVIAIGISIPIIFFTKFNFWGYGLEKDISIGLLAMVGGLTALVKYSYEKKRDLRLASIETVSFFREKLMHKNNEYIDKLDRHIAQEYAVPLQSNDISVLMIEYAKQIQNQMLTFGNDLNEVRKLKYEILNLAEEFALKVKYNGLIDSEVLFPLQKAFVDIVEGHSCLILFVRDLQYEMKVYNNAEELYLNWSKKLKLVPAVKNNNDVWAEIFKKIR